MRIPIHIVQLIQTPHYNDVYRISIVTVQVHGSVLVTQVDSPIMIAKTRSHYNNVYKYVSVN